MWARASEFGLRVKGLRPKLCQLEDDMENMAWTGIWHTACRMSEPTQFEQSLGIC